MCRQQFLPPSEWIILFQLNERLGCAEVARRRAHTNHQPKSEASIGEFLCWFPPRLSTLRAALAVIELFVDPVDQASRQRYASYPPAARRCGSMP